MKSEAEVKAKLEELTQIMIEQTNNFDLYQLSDTDAQRYIIEWVLGQHG